MLPITIDSRKPSEHHAFINLFHHMAERYSGRIFARYQTDDSKFKTLTYDQIDRITTNLACRWSSFLGTAETVGLIADHSVHYLLAMLALFKLRTELLAMSPRNPEAVNASLMQKTGSKFIFASRKYKYTAKACAKQLPGVDCHIFGAFDIDVMVKEPLQRNATSILNTEFGEQDEEKIAMILHSSGTTGFPKPIRLSNRYLICSLQCLPYDLNLPLSSTSLTTDDVVMGPLPLFHSFGFSVLLSTILVGASSLYFTRIPPSPGEIIDVMDDQGVTVAGMVPLNLSQLASHLKETGRYLPLQKLKYIQYAGAQLDTATGELFRTHNINVRNVYGCTEAAVLAISNHTDRKYSYTLSPLPGVKPYIEWEVIDRELRIYHAVIRAGAPFMATNASNRPDGGFSTNDLFTEEPIGSGCFRHLGRKDDMLVMENGEKINPTPMENTITSSTVVRRCTVIGQDRLCSGVLVELDFDQTLRRPSEEMIRLVHEAVQEANLNAPNHSTILPQMVYILAPDKHLPTTEKGTVNRKMAIEMFADAVERLYANFLNGPRQSSSSAAKESTAGWSLEQIEVFVSQAAAKVLQTDAAALLSVKDESLFDHGLNSLLSIQLRNQIAGQFDNVFSNFLFDHPSIASIARALGSNGTQTDLLERRCQETQALLDSYLRRANKDFSTIKPGFRPDAGNQQQEEVVLLTGATGSLGSFILRDMLLSPKVRKVYCLVRGEPDQLLARIRKSFSDRRIDVSLLDSHASKVVALPMELHEDHFGLSKELYDHLKSEVTLVQACAWLVDFNQPVSHFDKECIQGLYRLLQFAHRSTGPMHVHYVSSISATACMKTARVLETASPRDPHVTMPMGYAHSKYIVEHLFDYLTKKKNFPCIIERMGQVCGDSEQGAWNISEQYPLIMIGGGAMLGKVPDLKANAVDWIPVDYAASSIVDIMLKTASMDAHELAGKVFHIVNPTTITWPDVLEIMKTCGLEFEIVSPEEWIKALGSHERNPAYRLMSFFETTFLNSSSTTKIPVWDTVITIKIANALKEAPVFNAGLMLKYLSYWEAVGFYQPRLLYL